MYKHELGKNEQLVCLELEFCLLLSVVNAQSIPAYKKNAVLCWDVSNTALCLIKISQKLTAFVFGSTYNHQTFTECIHNQFSHFDKSTCQMNIQKKGLIPEWTIYKHVLENSKKCLSIGNFRILPSSLSVTRLQATPAYVEA